MAIFESEDRLIVAADTGPLLSVFQSNTAELLRRYFSCIFIVQSQLAEFQKMKFAAYFKPVKVLGLITKAA